VKAKSDIEFGKKSRDKNTGYTGVATGVYFFQYGCTRVTLTSLADGEIKECNFDEQGVEAVEAEKPLKSHAKSGGPRGLVPDASVRGAVCTRP
jgi:hypothetical protein